LSVPPTRSRNRLPLFVQAETINSKVGKFR
jgi:hypothetical protein